jgi:hypothetical protein
MHGPDRYRRNAADCLNAARKAHEPHYQRLYLLIAQSWLLLASHDDATDLQCETLSMRRCDEDDPTSTALVFMQRNPCREVTSVAKVGSNS